MKSYQAISLSALMIAGLVTPAMTQPAPNTPYDQSDPSDRNNAPVDSSAGAGQYGPNDQGPPGDQGGPPPPPPPPPSYDQNAPDYQAQRDAYQRQLQIYERQKRMYERQRAAYDAQFGPGGYRSDGPPPPPPPPGQYCRDREASGAVAGGVLGALAGAVIGSNIAGRGDRGGGAVLGGFAGGAIGASVGASSARCDGRGYYYAYDQTFPYREGEWESGRPSGRYDYGWYRDHQCRLAVAHGDWDRRDEDRYIRVCPDPDGRYRVTP